MDFGNKGLVVAEIQGELCPTGGPNFVLHGSYQITGGTGMFANHHTGTGTLTLAYKVTGTSSGATVPSSSQFGTSLVNTLLVTLL